MKIFCCLALSVFLPLFNTSGEQPSALQQQRNKVLQRNKKSGNQSINIRSKWHSDKDGYDDALEIQEQVGADIFVYFSRPGDSKQKGLCKWFEKKGLRQSAVRHYLREYIKLEVVLSGDSDNEALAKQFKVGMCPAVYIIRTNGWQKYCAVFDWPGGRPELKDPDELVDMFRKNSDVQYQEQEDD